MSVLTGEDKRYNNVNDAAMRIARSFIRFDNKPVFVECVESNMMAEGWDFESNHFAFNANDSRVDVASLPLGFINYDGTTSFACRGPHRQQKQGVSPENVALFNISTRQYHPASMSGNYLKSYKSPFYEEYPKLKDIGKAPLAFSRTWAVTPMGSDKSVWILNHRAKAIGAYIPSEKLFFISRGMFTDLRKRSLLNVLEKQELGGFDVVEQN